MIKIENLKIRESILYGTGFVSGEYEEELHIKRAAGEPNEPPKFYVGVYSNINGQVVRQGYLYFYLDAEKRKSNFIGAKVEEQFRDLNIGSFLVASWIDFCLNNIYEELGVNKKQRKPFLLFMLKKYGFDVIDITEYRTRSDVVSICTDPEEVDRTKFLMFRDGRHEATFLQTNTYKEDNYGIIHPAKLSRVPQVGDIIPCDRDIDVEVLDEIIFPLQNYHKNPADYELVDYLAAQKRIVKTLNRHRKYNI